MGKGRKPQKDYTDLIPRFTLEIKLQQLAPHEYNRLCTGSLCKDLFDCDRTTFFRMRFFPFETPPGKRDWYPNFYTMLKIAEYLGCTTDSLYNRTKERLFPAKQLEVIPVTVPGNQLEINPIVTHRKKRTA